jgi:HPt (histidine-containing phosphotransfer) domain-containing protein
MKPTRVSDSDQGRDQDRAQASASGPTVVPPPSASTKVLWGRAEALDRLGGDEELFRELCEIFIEESPKLLQTLRQAIAESDPDAVMRAAHSLKGELGYLGAETAVQASRRLEDMGHDKNLAQATEVFAVLERELAGLLLVMRESAGAVR